MGYRGITADLPCGLGGLNGNQNVFRIPITDLIKARNIRFDGFGWRKAPGLGLFDATPVTGAPTCLAGVDWRPDSATQRQVTAWNDGRIYKETGGNLDAVTLVSGLTFTDPVTFVEGGSLTFGADRELFMYSKNVAPQVLVADGASMAGITAESPDWAAQKPSSAVYHDARIVAFGIDSAPHNLYFSSVSDHGDFTAADSRVFEVAPGQGDRIVAGFSFLPQALYVFKYPRGIWTVDTTDLTGFFLPISLVRDDIGMAGPHAVAKVGNDVLFISSNGRLYSLTALRPDVDPSDADITARLNLTEFIKANVNAERLDHARLVYDEIRKEVWYIYTSKDGTVNDSALVFDINDLSTPKPAVEDRGNFFEAAWPRIDANGFTEILVGGEDGNVYRTNSPNRNIGGTDAYVAEFQYPDTDFEFVSRELGGREKRFDFLEVTVVPTGNYDLGFEILVDGDSKKTVTVNLGEGDSVFDTGVFDTAKFGGQTVVKHRVEIDACGNQLGLRGFNSGLNQDFSISNIRIYFRPLGNTYEA